MPQLHFKITNLTCAACVKLSVMALKKIDGVTDAEVDLITGRGELRAERVVAAEEVTRALHSVSKDVLILSDSLLI